MCLLPFFAVRGFDFVCDIVESAAKCVNGNTLRQTDGII